MSDAGPAGRSCVSGQRAALRDWAPAFAGATPSLIRRSFAPTKRLLFAPLKPARFVSAFTRAWRSQARALYQRERRAFSALRGKFIHMSEPKTMNRAVSDAPAAKEEGWWETIKVIVEALVIALVVRTVLFQPFNIPSGSLIPTLLIGDYLFVSKYSFGYSHYSLPGFLDLAPSLMPGQAVLLAAEARRHRRVSPARRPRGGLYQARDRAPRRQGPDDQGPALHQRRRRAARRNDAL